MSRYSINSLENELQGFLRSLSLEDSVQIEIFQDVNYPKPILRAIGNFDNSVEKACDDAWEKNRWGH